MSITIRKPQSLKIAFWNANSLVHKKHKVELFLAERNLDILLASETFLRPGHRFRIPNHNVYRRDRENGPGGGTGVIIKNNILHHELTEPDLDQAEANGIKITLANNTDLNIFSFYSPGARRLMEVDLDTITSTEKPCIVAGDFNAKHLSWNSRFTNGNGQTLRKHADNRGYEIIVPPEHTFHRAGARPDTIDIALALNFNIQYDIEVAYDLSSDHNPVILNLMPGSPAEKDTNSKRFTNWSAYNKHLEAHCTGIRRIDTTADIEQAVETLTHDIRSAIEANTRTVITERKQLYDIPPEIKNLIRQKRRAKRTAQITLSPDDRTEYNRLQRQVKVELEKFQNERWNAKLDEIEHNDKELCKITKSLRKTKINYPPSTRPPE